jgi:hypothetical protein
LFLKRGRILYYKERKYASGLELSGMRTRIGSRLPGNPKRETGNPHGFRVPKNGEPTQVPGS